MRIVKRLYLFVLKSFLPLFAMTFFIVLFIVLMQFLWKWIDELVGKGLSFGVMAELFFYAAVTLVPLALPLAILLASLMTFGNMGEKSELTAIKASGISLLQVMKPLIILIVCVAVGAFFFQNDVLPKAQVKMYTLLFSVKQKSPELEIPEGAFYNQIPGYNLYVKHKNKETGMLYDVMIYDVSHGGDNATILMSDSVRMAFTKDNRYLYLHLYEGEQFENLREQKALDRNVPFRREKFIDKQILIPFDANFNRMDEEGMRKQYVGKNISELQATIDSVGIKVDSLGDVYSAELRQSAFPIIMPGGKENTAAVAAMPHRDTTPLNLDSMLALLPPAQQGDVVSFARRINEMRAAENQYKATYLSDEKRTIRRHEMELIKKFTLSVACIIFFFIGAPLGAIIRKGGLGTPLVISVLLFVVYYMIDNTGSKMARDGRVEVWFGIWLSTIVLLPLGLYVTYKAMNDSAVFSKDVYVNFFRRVFGIREKRHFVKKEVIIDEVSPLRGEGMLALLFGRVSMWLRRHPAAPGYAEYWRRGFDVAGIVRIGEETDMVTAYLSDSRNLKVIDRLNRFPVVKRLWIYRVTSRKWLSLALMYFAPAGVAIWLVSRLYWRSLMDDMERIRETSLEEICLIKEEKNCISDLGR